ncbi:MAG TPA: ATP-dependent 6-phosphofructokinase [Candidatus Saccharimonadales bacterium]|nr:ATP-dependent 6-phosphofructokinase [Candidatus Saccharimonadales bacterium]
MSEIRKIGICTGGGDCPGLNAVIRAAVKTAILKYRYEVIGIRDGFDGLIFPEKSRPLLLNDVSGILPRGGTILGTTNRGNPFAYRMNNDGNETVRDLSDEVIHNARTMGLDALIVIGGDGTQKIGLDLAKKGLPVVGVPKTIDNDLSATDVTFGFDSAIHVATDAIDRIHTTAESHHRIMIIEVMGRDAGWIALHAGIAGGAHIILLPEIPFTIENVCSYINQRHIFGKKFTIISLAEGVQVPEEILKDAVQRYGSVPKGISVGNLIGEAISQCAKKEVRVTVLGHTQRGGSPSPYDRILSTRFGVAAVDLIAQRGFLKMVALRGNKIEFVDIAEAIGKMKAVDPKGDLVNTARAVGIRFGEE